MKEYREDLMEIEKEVQELMRERVEILGLERVLYKNEVDRLFEIHAEIGWCFERQSMLLPLVEDLATQSRWNSRAHFAVS